MNAKANIHQDLVATSIQDNVNVLRMLVAKNANTVLTDGCLSMNTVANLAIIASIVY